MSDSARVLSVDVLDQMRLALAAFGAESVQALDLADSEIRRIETWLEQMMGHWQAEVRRGEEGVFLAKQELARRKMMESRDHHVDCTDQERALQKAKARLRHAEDKVEVTRNWFRQLAHELEEYEGPARNLRSILEGDLPRASTLLENKAAALEAYLNVVAPGEVAAVSTAIPAESPMPVPSAAPAAPGPKENV
jgi:hypothetical protein